jgi:hypothetical protein
MEDYKLTLEEAKSHHLENWLKNKNFPYGDFYAIHCDCGWFQKGLDDMIRVVQKEFNDEIPNWHDERFVEEAAGYLNRKDNSYNFKAVRLTL